MKIRNISLFCIMLFAANLHAQNNDYLNNLQNILENAGASNPDFHLSLKPYNTFDIFHLKDSLYSQKQDSGEKHFGILKKEFKQSTLLYWEPALSVQSRIDQKKNTTYETGFGFNFSGKYRNMLVWDINPYASYQKIDSSQRAFADSFGIIYGTHSKYQKSGSGIYPYDINGRIAYKAGKFVHFEIGNGSPFIGLGYRSLLFSGGGMNFPYLSAEVNFWRLKYLWFNAKMQDFNLVGNNLPQRLFDKYAFVHYFSFKVSKRINIDFFEAVMSSPQSEYGNKGINVAYLNPVIFFRPVEFNEGSSDNALFGLAGNIRLFKSVHLYGQLMLDEFLFAELKARNGWWGNKQGYQAGIKIYNPFSISHFFVGTEYNYVRPYTYSHHYRNINYGAWRQPLAHPAGANFKEFVIYGRKQFKHIETEFLFSELRKGLDNNEKSSGGDPYKSYNLRLSDYNNAILQGELLKVQKAELSVSYRAHQLIQTVIFIKFRYESTESTNQSEKKLYFMMGLKSDIIKSRFDSEIYN